MERREVLQMLATATAQLAPRKLLTEWSDEPERARFLSGAIPTKNPRGCFACRYCGPCERECITRSYIALTARACDYAIQQMKKGALWHWP
jgi:hypothetical protein